MAIGESSYFNTVELHGASVPKDNARFVREELLKNSAGDVIEIRRYFLGKDNVEYYWSKEFYLGDPATVQVEDPTKRITIYPWNGPN